MAEALLALETKIAGTLRWHPEWRLGAVVALVWAGLVALAIGVSTSASGHAHAHAPAQRAPDSLRAFSDLSAAMPVWALMALAMMVPVTLPAVRHVGLNSMRRRRQRAMTLYSVVFVAVWVAFVAVALAAEGILRRSVGVESRTLLAGALAVAAGWQVGRFKRRTLVRCRQTVPLPPVGLRADAGCARFALRQAWSCLTSCWALMAVTVVVGHSLVWMAALTAWMIVEELTLLGRRLLRPSGAALAVAALFVALGA